MFTLTLRLVFISFQEPFFIGILSNFYQFQVRNLEKVLFDKIDQCNERVMSRMSVIENKLDEMEKKMDDLMKANSEQSWCKFSNIYMKYTQIYTYSST